MDTNYGQGAHNVLDPALSFYTSDSGPPNIWRADNFQALPDSISGIHWWGVEDSGDTYGPWEIWFFDDSGGQPGGLIYSVTVTPWKSLIHEGGEGAQYYYYIASITPPLNLPPGVQTWITIFDTGSTFANWSWLSSPEGDGISFQYDGSTGNWNPEPGDAGFCLTLSASTPTPVPCIHHGDVNFSGDHTAEDAQLAFFIVMGQITPELEAWCAADCNNDGDVTAGDAQMIFATVFALGACTDPL